MTTKLPSTETSSLAEAIRGHLPNVVAFSGARPRKSDISTTFPDDQPDSGAMSPKRQLEFRLGRLHARQALLQLGITQSPLPIGASGAPIWPEKISGSISHCDIFVGSMASKNSDLKYIGFDVEPAIRLDRLTGEIISSCYEISIGSKSIGKFCDFTMITLFSIKESIYKAFSKESEYSLNFLDVSVEIRENGKFYGHAASRAAQKTLGNRPISGGYGFAEGAVYSFVAQED